MSTILGVLHPWIETQVSNRLELPISKSELIQLALKVESTSAYQRHGSSTNVAHDNAGGGKGGKRVRSELDSHAGGGLGPATSRVRKDKPTIDTRPARDLSRVKCFNCS